MSLSAFAPENWVLQNGIGSPIPRQPAHLHTQAEFGARSRVSSRVSAAASINLFKSAIRYRVTQLLTVGVHCRESAGAGLCVGPKLRLMMVKYRMVKNLIELLGRL